MVTILLIEDNQMNLEMVKYLVESAGHICLTALEGSEGIRIAATDKPDLILCDIQLPHMDGYSIVSQLKKDTSLRGIPVIAVSSFAMLGDKEKALDAGFDGYMSKPINPRTFVEDVMRMAGLDS